MLDEILGAQRLDRLEQVPIENGLMFAGIALTLMDDLAEIDAVSQEIGQGPLRERDAADGPAGGQGPRLVAIPLARSSSRSLSIDPSAR